MDTTIEILVDLSNSMGSISNGKYLLPDGTTRMSAQKRILIDEVLPTIDYAKKVTIRTFYSGKEDILIAKIIYRGPSHLRSLQNVISRLPNDPQNTGGTPITDAITLSISELSKESSADKKIILVTDGQETGKGNYIVKAKEAMEKYNIPCKIFIIGIAQIKEYEEKAKDLAEFTKGAYININSNSYDVNIVKAQLTPLKVAIIKDTIDKDQVKDSGGELEQKGEKKLENKLIQIQQDSDKSIFINKIEELSSILTNQLENNQKLIEEFKVLKNQIVQSDFHKIRSTTLTIDSEYSEELRQKSEKLVYELLKTKYPGKEIVWLNATGESYSNHDFEVLNESGNIEIIIECKGTPANRATFYLTDYEWDYFREVKEIYQIIRVSNLDNIPKFKVIDNLYDSLMDGKVVPYLLEPEILKEKRIFLTLIE